MDRLFIGVDSGTQGVKVLVLDEASGVIVSQAAAPHELMENDRGGREQHPSWWIQALEKALAQALAAPEVDLSKVGGIGVSGQQHGMVPLDAKGNVIRAAKLWCDTETAPQCVTITNTLGGAEAVVSLTGNAMAAGFTAPKLLWLKENEPENYAALDCVLLPHDYINFHLTGERCTEYGDASGTAYFDVRRRTWCEPVLDAIDPSGRLEQCLPELRSSDAPAGYLLPDIAERFGLPKGIPVSSGGGDNMMAAIGTGAVRPGVVTASLGTSGTIFTCADRPVIDPRGELAAFCSSSGAWLPLVCTMNVTVATELTRKALGLDLDDMARLASNAPIGSGGLTLLPYFNGERTPPLPDATATLAGLTSVNYTPENLCRAAFEGATLGLRYGLDVLTRLGVTPGEIRLVGGGAKSPLWRQIVADVFRCSVVLPETSEAGALGAAIQAVWCCHALDGIATPLDDLTARYVRLRPDAATQPNTRNMAAYQQIYSRYLDLNQALEPVYRRK